MKKIIKRLAKNLFWFLRKPQFIKSGNFNYAFLHVGKTGGSGIAKLSRTLIDSGYRPPIKFNHAWKMREIIRVYPKLRLAVVLRDPLERIVSGFNSRLRQGLPYRRIPWRKGEEKAFSFFPNVCDFLRSLISEDEKSKSAAMFAINNISHLRRGYVYHFHSVDFIRKSTPIFLARASISS